MQTVILSRISAGHVLRRLSRKPEEIELTEFGGKKIVYGFNGLVNGSLQEKQEEAFKKAVEKGFKGIK